MNPEKNPVEHLEFLDGLRAVAALFVLCSHTWYQVWPAVLPPFGYGSRPTGMVLSLTAWLYYGHFAVVVFIVLSGFCLMLPVSKNNGVLRGGMLRFFQRRFKRILPPYYCALLFSLALIWIAIDTKTGSQWDISLPITQEGLTAHFFVFQDFVTSTQINYVFWSIALELHLYMCFPLLILCWRLWGGINTMLIVGGITYSTIALMEIFHFEGIPAQFIGLCFYFVIGMLGATAISAKNWRWQLMYKNFPWFFTSSILIFIMACFCYVWGFDTAEKRFAFLDTLCALSTFCLLMAASRPGTNKLRILLSSRFLVFVGTFSYSLYLVHAPLLQLIWQYLCHPLHCSKTLEFLLLLICNPLIIFFAYIFYFFCEKPFLNTCRVEFWNPFSIARGK
jgi:peptidoglycan/LPS O-acetylase OafA/YrhL